MDKNQVVEIFETWGAEEYDKSNSAFMPIQNNLHFLNQIILQDLPENANILCVGVGTGADIVELAKANNGWSFVGIDPAENMLAGCKKKLAEQGIEERCELFHGYLNDYSSDIKFDAVLCLFVMHFIEDLDERQQMYKDMNAHLKKDGYLVVTEIGSDLNSDEFDIHVEKWKALKSKTGAPEERLDKTKDVLINQLKVLSPSKTKELIKSSGFNEPIEFFQALLIHGWFATKS